MLGQLEKEAIFGNWFSSNIHPEHRLGRSDFVAEGRTGSCRRKLER